MSRATFRARKTATTRRANRRNLSRAELVAAMAARIASKA